MPECVFCGKMVGSPKRVSKLYETHVRACKAKTKLELKHTAAVVPQVMNISYVQVNNSYNHTPTINNYLTAAHNLTYEMISDIDKVNHVLQQLDKADGGWLLKCFDMDGTAEKSQAIAFYQDVAKIIRDKIAANGNSNLALDIDDYIQELELDHRSNETPKNYTIEYPSD